MPRTFTVNGRSIGTGEAPYIIAEMSGNHNGELNRAIEILDKAKAAGADAVKLQTYTADTITIDHDGPEFVIEGGLWDGRRLYELYDEAHTPWDWHEAIFRHGQSIGLTVFSAPFDPTAIDLLESLDAPIYKIASPEIVDLPLIRKVAATGKPMIISTGMASFDEIEEAVLTAKSAGAEDIVVLHCTSAYPTPPDQANLATISDLANRLDVMTGLSDHSMGTAVSVAAIASGAVMIEKHFTLSRADGGVDSAFSLEPEELASLVESANVAHAAIGTPHYRPTTGEAGMLKFRRSLYVVSDVAKGDVLTHENVRSIRPNNGLAPKHLDEVLGRAAVRDLKRGEPVAWDMLDKQ